MTEKPFPIPCLTPGKNCDIILMVSETQSEARLWENRMKLHVVRVSKRFGSKEVLREISFSVESGRAMGFLGRNGAGKTTALRCLMGVFRQDSGTFLLEGQPFVPQKQRIGYLPEERGLYMKSPVLDQLVYFAMLRGAKKQDAKRTAEAWVDAFGLGEWKKKPLEQLSKGNQQKIQIAQCFLSEPDILIMDEPFSGLDPVNAEMMKDAVRDMVRQGKLVIFSSHQLSLVDEVCDDITLIHHGEILLSGSLKDIRRTMGQNKLYLVPEEGWDTKAGELASAFPGIVVVPAHSGLIIDTKGLLTQRQLFAFLSEKGWPVTQLGFYEPSLTDIFVAQAGEEP